MPRDLRDSSIESLFGGGLTDIGGAGGLGDYRAVVPWPCELICIPTFVEDALVSVETTFDVIVSDTVVAQDAHLSAIAEDTGEVMFLDAPVVMQEGDWILLQANGETTGAPRGHFSYLLKPLIARDLDLIALGGGSLTAIQTAGNSSAALVCPVKGRLVGVVLNPRTVISTASPPEPVSFDVLKNTADTAGATGAAVDILLPDAQPLNDGILCLPDAEIFVDVGDALILQSNGEQVAATVALITWIIKADVRDLREFYIAGGTIAAVQTTDNASRVIVVPERCELLGVSMNVDTEIVTLGGPQTFDVLKNTLDTASVTGTAVDVDLTEGTAADTGLFLPVDARVFCEDGDALSLQSNGEQVAATTADLTWHFRR